uniref:Uncharacterized protein n=1 Tax=Esox lucius TaxID=8010 RepID=A0AAY5L3A8_ESOLU
VGEGQVAGCHRGLGHIIHLAEHQDGQAQQEPQHPNTQADALSPGGPSQPALTHRSDQRQIAVDANLHQEEDATIVVHGDGHVDQLAHELAEHPVVVVSYGRGPEGQAGH